MTLYTPGPEFEGRIRLNEAGNTKFNILNPHDPYHAYHRHKIVEIQEGVGSHRRLLLPLANSRLG